MKGIRMVSVCFGTECVARGAREVEKELLKLASRNVLKVTRTSCSGNCQAAPVLRIDPEGFLTGPMTVEKVRRWAGSGFDPAVLESWRIPEQDAELPRLADHPFFRHQRLVVLKNRGRIDPDRIEDYMAAEGYDGLARALAMSPGRIIETIKAAGLRGRGGAGFPTGVKWELCRRSRTTPRYLVCNADEGDPGAYMDRSILEGDPHAVIEGMIIGARAIGASRGYVYVRDEYPLAVERIQRAIEAARGFGLLGANILGTDLNFDLEVVRGGGAFVCGEETALMASIEGKVGRPRPRPPYPSEKGLWGRPTNINNVETWANVAPILRNGSAWFASLGTDTSKGTKVFSLVGKVCRSGLVEVPMGIPLRTVVEEIGGGVPDGRKFKAVQTGGPSGGCIPASMADLPVDYEALTQAGAIMGSGGLIVMDETTCMVDLALYFVRFLVEESCGKCTPCRVGLKRMEEMLTAFTLGLGQLEDLKQLESLAKTIQDGSLCGLGQTAPNPVLTALRYFKEEFESHIMDKKCPAGVCKALITLSVDAERCTGCGLCRSVCPVGAVSGSPKSVHEINTERCTRCGACVEQCRFDAIIIQ
ncbi:MAG TPA: 4Fe-4S dicluster domain-containing protein [bacterium]|nr:4Fe-4S dicluster domain-containing protein [bacterium]